MVDEDPRAVEGLQKGLYSVRHRWEVATATSVEAALQALASGAFDALICEGKRPGFDGEALLQASRQRWPGMLRVVLTAEVREDSHRRLTQLAHHFIPKPVAAAVLFARIEEALAARALLGSPELQALIVRLGTLPTLPDTFAEVTRLVERPDATLEQLVKVVERDPLVCGNVLRAVNSAWFGLSTRVGNAKEAVRLLGFKPLRALVLASEVFGGNARAFEVLRSEAFERLAVVPQLLKVLRARELIDAASTAAVLVDVGQLVLQLRAPGEADAVTRAVAQGERRVDAEQRLLGATHPVIGSVLMHLWSLPADLADAVALHHGPRPAPPARGLSTVLALLCGLQDLRQTPAPQRAAAEAELLELAGVFQRGQLDELLDLFPQATQEAA